MAAPSLTGSRTRVQITGAQNEEEAKYLRELMQHFDYFQSKVPGYVDDRERVRSQLRGHASQEDRQFNYRLLTGLFRDWDIPYAGGPAQDPVLMLDAPYANAPYLGGTRNCVIVRAFRSPFLSVDIDLEYTQKAIKATLKELIDHYQRDLRPAGLVRTVKEKADLLRDAREFHERKGRGETHEKIAEAMDCSVERVVDLAALVKRMTEKGGLASVAPHIRSDRLLEKRQALAAQMARERPASSERSKTDEQSREGS